MNERKLQTEAIRKLKDWGCWTMKTRPGMGTPTGTADIFFCKGDFYGWLECKRSSLAPLRPGQLDFIIKMDAWSYARIIYPENYDEIMSEIARNFGFAYD